MFLKMIFGSLTRRKTRFLLIAFTVALGVSLATAMLNVMFDVGDKVNQELRAYGANLNVIPRGVSILGETYDAEDSGAAAGRPAQTLREDDLGKIKMIFWANNIVDFAPYLETKINANGIDATLVGTWFDKHLDLPTGDEVDTGMKRMKSWWEVAGEFPRDDAPRGVMVGKALAGRLGIAPGDSFTIAGPDGKDWGKLAVRAVFHSGGDDDERIYAPLALAQEIAGRPGQVERVEVSALTTPENELARRAARDPNSLSRMEWDTWYCTAYISSIAYQIEEALPGARVKPVLQVAESEGAILQKTQLLMLLLTGLSLVCSALAISNLVTANVMERGAEIALLKAIGANTGSVIVLVLTELFLTAFAGGILGYFAGLGFAQIVGYTVFGSQVAVKMLVIPLIAALVALVTLLGSLPAMRLLLRLRPAEALHGK
ncbi:MAG: ABC transporter permease [Candidatus Accumulibacter sp.]|jgi:putative ABC transport system permease protein|nr:ABC transporter permease [Accumulibacter sp.]